MAVYKNGSRGSGVKDLQQQLKDAGFDPGPIDGIYGPKTKAAVWAFQKKAGITVDGIAGPQTFGALAEWDGGSGSGGGDGGDGEKKTDDEMRRYIQSTYPQLAWALDHKELGPILTKAGEEEWDRARISGAVQGTDYWKDTSATQRQADAIQNNDPAEWRRMLDQKKQEIRTMADQMGLSLKSSTLSELAQQSIRLGYDDTQLNTAVINQAQPINLRKLREGETGGQLGEIYQTLEDVENAYLLPLDNSTKRKWLSDILAGKNSIDGLRQYAQNLAVSQNPWMKSFIDQGLEPNQALEPYRNQIARTLEINPATIDFQNNEWQNLVAQKDDKGEWSVANFAQLQENIRRDKYEDWNKTSNAKQSAQALTGEIATMFGRRA